MKYLKTTEAQLTLKKLNNMFGVIHYPIFTVYVSEYKVSYVSTIYYTILFWQLNCYVSKIATLIFDQNLTNRLAKLIYNTKQSWIVCFWLCVVNTYYPFTELFPYLFSHDMYCNCERTIISSISETHFHLELSKWNGLVRFSAFLKMSLCFFLSDFRGPTSLVSSYQWKWGRNNSNNTITMYMQLTIRRVQDHTRQQHRLLQCQVWW